METCWTIVKTWMLNYSKDLNLPLLDYSKDLNLPLFHFISTNQPYQNSSNSIKPESPESSMFSLRPQISTNAFLLSQQEPDKSWSCSYENTDNLSERDDVSFWFAGERNIISESPQCGNDYSQRLEFLDKVSSDGYNSILKGIGLRVIEKVGTVPSRGFHIGYRFFPGAKWSGLASNPANRQIASSSGASAEHHKKKFSIFLFFFPPKTWKNMI